MITQQYRPKTFKEVAGHKSVVETLKCVAKNPENAPRTIILQGEFGTGKTTCARILARALNCKNQVNGEPCGNCPVCNSDLDVSPFYIEYDSAVVGNVDAIRDLRETFYYNSNDGYRVVVLDECHLISNQAQGALLKVFEETKGNIFFVLCTTDAQKLLPTIRSRSLELTFNLIPEIYLKENIKQIAEKEHIEIDDEALDLIVTRSGGHARNAQMLLDRYKLLGDVFKSSVKTSKDDFAKLILIAIQTKILKANIVKCKETKNDYSSIQTQVDLLKTKFADIIYKLQCNSLSSLKTDYEDTILDIMKVAVDAKTSGIDEINKCAKFMSQSKTTYIAMYKLLTSDSIVGSFKSDKQFQAAMWLLYVTM